MFPYRSQTCNGGEGTPVYNRLHFGVPGPNRTASRPSLRVASVPVLSPHESFPE